MISIGWEAEASHPIEITQQQSLQAIQNCIGEAGKLVQTAADESAKSQSSEYNMNPSLSEATSLLRNLGLFSEAIGASADISSSLDSEADSVEQEMGPGQGNPANMSHFASLFSQWSSSFLSDVEKKLG